MWRPPKHATKEDKTIFSVCSGEAAKISRWFWAAELWLPGNITWEEYYSLPSKDKNSVSNFVWYSLVVGVVLVVVRLLFERFVFVPVAASFGIHKPRVRKLTSNPILEDACKRNSPKTLKNVEIQVLAKELSWTERQVERWFRDRKRQNKVPPQQKFIESSWRFTIYTFMVVYGYIHLRDKPYFVDMSMVYDDPRNKPVETGIYYWYGYLEGGLYLSLLASSFTDVKRKDFTMMLTHHVITLLTLVIGYFCCITESGALLLFWHDVADIFLESVKLSMYLKTDRVTGPLLVVFFIVWCATRLYIIPIWIIQHVLRDSAVNMGPLPYMVFAFIMLLLVSMHVIWTWAIIRTFHRSLVHNSVGDDRSDDSEQELLSEDEDHRKAS